jgi:surface protein
LNKWSVSSVTNMNWMFMSATSFDQDLSKWDVSKARGFTKCSLEPNPSSKTSVPGVLN